MKRRFQTIRFVLGDQLTPGLSSLSDADPDRDLIVMAEPRDEARYVPHHRQKIVMILSAMRHFANELRDQGFEVEYFDYQDRPVASFTEALKAAIDAHDIKHVVITQPGEWRVKHEIESWSEKLGVSVDIRPDDRFFAPLEAFEDFAKDRKELRMEYFYRGLRRETGILIEPDGKPVGGQWNFDHDNRKRLPDDVTPPAPKTFAPDKITQALLDRAMDDFPDALGNVTSFGWPVTRKNALIALDQFITHRLPCFGDYQDAMTVKSATLYHSLISPCINIGLLLPDEVCRAVEKAYHEGKGPLNAVEGFIRQILGWREYVRGLYWYLGPDYGSDNHFKAKRPLPGFFWDGDVPMNCLKQAIGETLENAYAHHIQRLMVIGNFALLAGLDPKEVCDWYLAVYIDAFEWVELPNTFGMALYADGGKMASKPYAASGKYIDRMSDYCQGCQFNPRKNTGTDACPFNALYWHFMDRNADKLGNNPRLGMPYRNWARMKDDNKRELIDQADAFLAKLDAGNLNASPAQADLF
ncbi:cryptochrome/photolyase family protein [Thalassospira sp.]|uniref:cryptochrome/photolyase family protein n=1 Tax=Thalassospira sp. TaxID=1912094 RepID=UPI000C623E8E|nr:cryptochrome/photolyase family protein [Thalassospira sp.]MBC06046.1 cryptochrome/photolyase family protein [Thalassospira sp.]|tara:strand:+ start:5104 stop:6681 length:1578 start_codon:yes stop_codon:yes gene_type:complete